jgi:hypothetical protein
MRYWTILINKLPATAMAVYPFMIFKNQKVSVSRKVIRHELIHFHQQLELLILPFYVLYFLSYLLNLLIYRDHDKAYRNICFEVEAYANDDNPDYLPQRKMFAWMRHQQEKTP